jgi:voltage-gated sodium channel
MGTPSKPYSSPDPSPSEGGKDRVTNGSQTLGRGHTNGDPRGDTETSTAEARRTGGRAAGERSATITATTEELIHKVLTRIENPEDGLHANFWQKLAYQVHHSNQFNTLVSLTILINAIYIGVETENPHWSQSVNGGTPTRVWETFLVEVLFQTFFTFELVIKFLGLGVSAFRDSLTIFDTLLVLIGFVDCAVTLNALAYDDGQKQTQSDLSFVLSLRVLRIVRISRVLRLLRLLRAFKELWLMVSGILSSVRTIAWAWALIVLIIYVFAIVAVRIIGRGEHKDNPWVQEYFGYVVPSMFTYFQIMTLEGWAEIARPLMGLDVEFRSEYDPQGTYFYPVMLASILVFMSVTSFAIMNVVVAVIVENTLDQAVLKRDTAMQKIRREQKEAVQKAYEIFAACDANGDGSLEQYEFVDALRNTNVQLYLHEVGIDVADAESLFDILDHDQSGVLSVSEFVDGCIRARGGARAKEMMMLHCDIFKMFKKVRMDIMALQERTPISVEHPWPKESDSAEPNGGSKAPETQADQPSQSELRTRVEGSIHKAESTLAEVRRRVNLELDALEEKLESSSRAVVRGNSKSRLSSGSTAPPADRRPLDSDEAERCEVEDLIRGSKTLDDLLRDVETDLEQANLNGQLPAG